VGYAVFGKELGNYNDILAPVRGTTKVGMIVANICTALLVLHLLCALPIASNPIFAVIERRFNKGDRILSRIILRSIVFVLLIIVALVFPYFLDFMGLVTNISVAMTVYVLPVLFYMKLGNPKWWEIPLLWIVIVFSLNGSIVGVYNSVSVYLFFSLHI